MAHPGSTAQEYAIKDGSILCGTFVPRKAPSRRLPWDDGHTLGKIPECQYQNLVTGHWGGSEPQYPWHEALDLSFDSGSRRPYHWPSTGPPCETWTSARFHAQLDDQGNEIRGPRPLRSAQQLWGLAFLTIAELAQIFTGNCLLLKGLYLAVIVALRGGAVFLEHPANPYNEDYPSDWRLGLIRLLLRQPNALMRRITIEQWRYGAAGVKPTTLLFANAPLPDALQKCQLENVQRPEVHLIGKNASGQYRTAAAKEYPMALNKSFATALTALVSQCAASTSTSDTEPYGSELVALAVSTEYISIQPDYQPHWGFWYACSGTRLLRCLVKKNTHTHIYIYI